ncbi:MAG: NAD(P)H-dependent oxidoreductase [Pseudomonadales bacterium]
MRHGHDHKVTLLGLSGSLRAESSNTTLLRAAAETCRAGVEFALACGLGELPHFNPDLPLSTSPRLLSFVEQMRTCDGLVVSSPVYAGGYPGTLKNALDWLVGTDAFVDKPFMMLSASSRMPAAQATLVTVLQTMSGRHIETASITIDLLGTHPSVDGILRHPEHGPALRAALARFAEHLR